MQQLHSLARRSIEEAQLRQAADYNKRHLPAPFKVGELVKLSTEDLQLVDQPSAKFRQRFVGPFPITAQVSPVAFKLQLPAGSRLHDVFHVSKPWKSDEFPRPVPFDQPLRLKDRVFYVERILDVDLNRNGSGLLFQVRWAYPFNVPSEDTWEPLRNVKDCQALSEFLASSTWRDFRQHPSNAAFFRRYCGTARVPAETSDRKGEGV